MNEIEKIEAELDQAKEKAKLLAVPVRIEIGKDGMNVIGPDGSICDATALHISVTPWVRPSGTYVAELDIRMKISGEAVNQITERMRAG